MPRDCLFELLLKFSDFVNSDHCIGKITLNSIRLRPLFIPKKYIKLKKKQDFASEKIKNSGNYIHDYMLTRSSERIFKLMRYTG